MKIKYLAAAGALLASSGAYAFDADGQPFSTGTGDGSGTVYLSVFDDTGDENTQSAFIIDTGLVANDFINNDAGQVGFSFSHAELDNFLQSAVGTIRWDVMAINNNGTDLNSNNYADHIGMLTTVSAEGSTWATYSTLTGGMMQGQAYWLNTAGFGNEFMTFLAGDANDYVNPSFHGALSGNYETEGNLGDSLAFYDLYGYDGRPPRGGASALASALIDVWTLSFDGDVAALTYGEAASVVPVPAAAWLFGSALLGLVGVARRKA